MKMTDNDFLVSYIGKRPWWPIKAPTMEEEERERL